MAHGERVKAMANHTPAPGRLADHPRIALCVALDLGEMRQDDTVGPGAITCPDCRILGTSMLVGGVDIPR